MNTQNPKPFKHGSSGYRYHKCRCEICVTSQRKAHRTWIEANYDWSLEYARQKHKDRYKRLRQEALETLGGECIHCHHDDLRVLQIDHINGGGREDRKKHGRTDSMYLSIVKHGHQDKYQVLCANCHVLKTHHGLVV